MASSSSTRCACASRPVPASSRLPDTKIEPNLPGRTRRDPSRRLRFSIVVPVYNEAGLVAGLVARLVALRAFEVIVVDADSRDGTAQQIEACATAGLRVTRSGRGRARQMNHGALQATGDVLLFLHADTRLPPDALVSIERGLNAAPQRVWGRFDVGFDDPTATLRLVAWMMNRRSALTGICTGDQALFVYRREFLALGGFAPLALMEDIELSTRLRRCARPLRLAGPAITSARRWREAGVWRTIFLMWRLRWHYWRGVPTTRLARHYYGDR